MSDSVSLKVMVIFEVCARLRCDPELTCMAAHLYHKFLRSMMDTSGLDLYAVAGACIRLAHWHFSEPLDIEDLILVIAHIAKLPPDLLDESGKNKLVRTIEIMTTVVLVNINFLVDFKDFRMATPGELSRLQRQANTLDETILSKKEPEISFEVKEDEEELLMVKYSRNLISPHRYLTHYLQSIELVIEDKFELGKLTFKKIANLSLVLLSDIYWSPSVLQFYASHIACACLMVAIESHRKDFELDDLSRRLFDRKWHLIFCDDLSDVHLKRIILQGVVRQYETYERIFEKEFNTASVVS